MLDAKTGFHERSQEIYESKNYILSYFTINLRPEIKCTLCRWANFIFVDDITKYKTDYKSNTSDTTDNTYCTCACNIIMYDLNMHIFILYAVYGCSNDFIVIRNVDKPI